MGFGVSPDGPGAIGHAITNRYQGDIGANRLDCAGSLEPEAGWQWQRVETAPVIYVDEVDPDCRMPDQDFPGAGLR